MCLRCVVLLCNTTPGGADRFVDVIHSSFGFVPGKFSDLLNHCGTSNAWLQGGNETLSFIRWPSARNLRDRPFTERSPPPPSSPAFHSSGNITCEIPDCPSSISNETGVHFQFQESGESILLRYKNISLCCFVRGQPYWKQCCYFV